MRIAVFSDVHGNLLALEAVLADIRTRGVDSMVNLGDWVAGPLWPRETFELLAGLGIPSVRGNHDRWAIDRPDDFDIERPPMLALGFGYGIHSCLGAALARMESRIAIEEMVRRWPEFSIDEDGLRRVHMSNVAGYANVPVTTGVGSRAAIAGG